MELIKPDIQIDFIGKLKYCISVSILFIVGTFALIFYKGGINYGIDFSGGMIIQVKLNSHLTISDVKKVLEKVGVNEPTVQDFGDKGANEYLIRVSSEDIDINTVGKNIKSAFKELFAIDAEIRRVEMVGPKISQKLSNQALLAIFFAILFMAIYISGRFEQKWIMSGIVAIGLAGAMYTGYTIGASVKLLIVLAVIITLILFHILKLRYALGATVALIHDVIITLGVFLLADKEISLAIVAAFLTIVGYSLNDTIIVYDRIRENRRSSKEPLPDIINRSVNQTLSRTILTSGTTVMALVVLYLFGGGIIRDFCFALIAGIIVGTYSSIYIASPILMLLEKGSKPKTM